VTVSFSDDRISYSLPLDTISPSDFFNFRETLPALNTSILIQGYSLFEASFERFLLEFLSTNNLTGIQEKVMENYINEVLKLSSEKRLAEEFNFITGSSLASFFSRRNMKNIISFKRYTL
jgi:hypothetical protein